MGHWGKEMPSRLRRSRAVFLEGFVLLGGVVIAFVMGYYSLDQKHLRYLWQQNLMSASVNYACTGNFGSIQLSAYASEDDKVAVAKLNETFLSRERLDYSCNDLPNQIDKRPIWEGLDVANVEQPLYLMIVYGVLWRWFGLHWAVTYVVIATTVAASFLVLYICARRFMGAVFAAGLVLLFLSSPFFVTHLWSPRDAIKFPFAVGIAGLLVAGIAARRKPFNFLGFASSVGALIGVGYGFRSDILYFLAIAAAIILFLGRIDLGQLRPPGIGRCLADLGLRSMAVATLLLLFVIGGLTPLINDLYIHPGSVDAGYHPMAMGLLGITRQDLYQQDEGSRGNYMFRNRYNNDLSIGVRVIEYAERHNGQNIAFDTQPYWEYAKTYYLAVVKKIPADLIAGAIGAFVNLMSVPKSLGERQTLAPEYDHNYPWTGSTAFPSLVDKLPYFHALPRWLDSSYAKIFQKTPAQIFFANLAVTFVFLCLIAVKFGIRSAIAAMLLLCGILAVTSLKFEQRHMFYIYAFPLLAWGAVISVLCRGTMAVIREINVILRGDPVASPAVVADATFSRILRATVAVTFIIIGSIGAGTVILLAAREYQATVLQALISDWTGRSRVPAKVEVSEVGSAKSRLRIISEMPKSTGGKRLPDDAITSSVEMGVVVVQLDGRYCAQQPVNVTAVGESNITNDTAFKTDETFSGVVDRSYLAFFPAFYYRYYDKPRINSADMYFAGIDVDRQNVLCVTGVSLVNDFRRDDVLFDFFLPKDIDKLPREQLYQRVLLPGVGYI